MNLIEKFRKEPWHKQLEKRRFGFEFCIDHFSRHKPRIIVETGTLRIPDNWAGDGQSTRIWDWYARQLPVLERPRIFSVDHSEEFVALAKSLTTEVEVVHSDSVAWLSKMPLSLVNRIDFLYLDSFDWAPEINLDSAFHHLAELTCVWYGLPSGAIVMVDDRHGTTSGKHWLIDTFFEKLGVRSIIEGYQIAWQKP